MDTTTTTPRLVLRDYQQDALARVAQAEADGCRRQLGVAATGLGKTVMFASLAEQRGGRCLVLVHRDELVRQAVAKLQEVWPAAQVGVVKAERNDVTAHVVVASVQTLARPRRLQQLLDPIDGASLLLQADPFGLVVVDEAHHATADTYRGVLDALQAGQVGGPCPGCQGSGEVDRLATPDEVDAGSELGVWTGACERCGGLGVLEQGPLLLGVTATPDRGDGQGLHAVFDRVVFSYDILWGIQAGYLSDLRGRRIRVQGLDLSKVKLSRGDYQAGDTGRALEDAGAPQAIVRAWQKHASGRRTLVFTPTVAVAEHVAAEFVAAGVAASYVHAGTDLEDRRRILRDYSAGAIQVLANCAVLTEGYDEPRTDCIVVARATKSRALYTQMVGRGTRRHPDKTDCLVLDVVGVSADHSLVTIPSLFGVEGKRRKGLGDGTASVAATVLEQQQEQVQLGVLRAEDVDLFATVNRTGVAWVQVHRPGERRRYVCTLGKGRAVVHLAESVSGDGWVCGVQLPDGTKRVLMDRVGMELAQGVGEDYARAHGPAYLVDRNAPWRSKPPTAAAKAAARKWHLPDVDAYRTGGELSDALDALITRVQARKASATKGVTSSA